MEGKYTKQLTEYVENFEASRIMFSGIEDRFSIKKTISTDMAIVEVKSGGGHISRQEVVFYDDDADKAMNEACENALHDIVMAGMLAIYEQDKTFNLSLTEG